MGKRWYEARLTGMQERAYQQARRNRNATAALDRRTKLLLAVEYCSRDFFAIDVPNGMEKHPTKPCVVVEKLTPLLKELIEDKCLRMEVETFPKEGIHRTLIFFVSHYGYRKRETVAPKPRVRGIDL